ncbi:MAG: extracellular solute-binding protein [Alphaproteobacteria bacterium]|nr:extracellular solute-binding protein [Alphaproteobacteria bacterium]
MKDGDRKDHVAASARAFADRRIGKREFLRRLAVAGIGLSGFATAMLGGSRPSPAAVSKQALADHGPSAAMTKWLRDVGGKYRGTKIRYVSEPTPPSVVAKLLAKDEFTASTGIDVDIEIVPLEQVLHRATMDVKGQLGAYDLYYLDQSWTSLFIGDTIDPREYFERKRDLALPDFDWDDFSKTLMLGISTYEDKVIGIPFDIPIFILMYRKDLFDKHGLQVPTTMDAYMKVVRALDEAERGNGIHGTTGQLRAGHYSLTCDWTAWLWANGGSVFGKDGFFSGGDEDGMRGLAYMLDLVRHMPAAATTWTWDGEYQSIRQGDAAMAISWAEFFPGFDGSGSKVVGLMEAARPPAEARLRSPDEAGFLEVPHIGHQGGSSICLSRYSRNPEAAWIFMQWVCSKDVSARSAILGSGAAAVRNSTYKDARVLAAARVGQGTTRHFPATEWTINNAMGTEPKLPAWVEISNDIIPVELGRLLSGQYGSPDQCMAAIKERVDRSAAPFRRR